MKFAQITSDICHQIKGNKLERMLIVLVKMTSKQKKQQKNCGNTQVADPKGVQISDFL